MADRLTRIAIIAEDRCKPKKCRQECKKSCPVVKTGKLCIEVTSTSKTAFLSEELCIGCGICVKKCPFEAIQIINLPRDLEKDTTHRYGANSFKLHRFATAYIFLPQNTKELQDVVMDSIIHPTVKGMAEEGCKFVGVLFAGLMIEKKSGLPKLIEFNVRFGDPECQVLMMRLESDLAKVLLAACRGELSGVSLDWSKDSAMVVAMASKGYPGAYEKGSIIKNLEEAETVASGVKVFHAGTDLNSEGNVIAIGGRVLGVTAKGKDLEEARERAYWVVQQINWPGGFFRRDIDVYDKACSLNRLYY